MLFLPIENRADFQTKPLVSVEDFLGAGSPL